MTEDIESIARRAETLYVQGRHRDSIEQLQKLTRLQPANPLHFMNLGTALRLDQQYDAAIRAFVQALSLGERSAGLFYNVGALHVDRGDYAGALAAFARAREIDPLDAHVNAALAQVHHDCLRPAEALEYVQAWRGFHGLTLDLTAQLAHIAALNGADVLGAELTAQALEGARTSGRTSLPLIRVLERVNRVPEARSELARLHESGAAPEVDALLIEGLLLQRAGDHAAACAVFQRAHDLGMPFARRYVLLFPFARSLDALHRYDEAWARLDEAHRSQVAHLELTAPAGNTRAAAALTLTGYPTRSADIEPWKQDPGPDLRDSPIFIVGFPRSGTTLLEVALDAHPALRSMDEQPFLNRCIEEAVARGCTYPEGLGALQPADLEALRLAYWERVRAKVQLAPGQRLVDKNPLNMLRLPIIRRLFPNSRIILALRHPCDVIISCYMQHFRAPDLARICASPLTLAEAYRRAFDFWYDQQAVLEPAVRELRYESLVEDVPGTMRSLCEFLELPFDEAMVAPHTHARGKGFISTPSYSQVVQPVTARAVGRWAGYRSQLEAAIKVVAPYLERWDYRV